MMNDEFSKCRKGEPMRAKVLLIEDDEGLRELLVFHMAQAGFEVQEAKDLAEAWPAYQHCDVIVLDWMLPDGSGVDWLKRVRAGEQTPPVLMLTARASEVDKVTGLNAGADDYLVKPFSTAELIARLRALLRRTQSSRRHTVGELTIDYEQGIVTFAGERLQLTRREFDLLAFLASSPGRVFSRVELLDRVWGEDFLGTERTVDQHIAQLRALIGAHHIETVRGRGYRLVDPRYND